MPRDQEPRTVEYLEPGHDPVNDQMRYSCSGDGREFEVRISRTAMTEAKPSPEQRIEDWFKYNPLPDAGASVRIPDSHFDPRRF
jgi:hypothetical protein